MRGHCNYFVIFRTGFVACLAGFLLRSTTHGQIPETSRQVIVAIAPDANSHHAAMQVWQRERAGGLWKPAFEKSWAVLLGKNGLAWGLGIFSTPDQSLPEKSEKDGRTPAGIFRLGPVVGNANAAPRGTTWPYTQAGKWDAWIDDPKLPHYNEHVRVDPQNVPAWFESQRMRLGDDAYKWLLEIKHNPVPARAGAGSAIFFHVRRGPDRPSAGCTTMAQDDLEKLIRWLRPEAEPVYVLLTRMTYESLSAKWKLP